jgi:hypothetical protein
MERRRSTIEAYRPALEAYRPPLALLEHRILLQRRRYGQGLNRRPTADELSAMWRAARLRVIADYALGDPACDANTQVRLSNAADRAVARMQALLDANRPPERLATLDEMLAAAP